MAKQQFFWRLIPPRPTSPQDMDEHERRLMEEHAAHFREFFDKGAVLAYGPVLDPQGVFGLALLEVDSREEAEQFAHLR